MASVHVNLIQKPTGPTREIVKFAAVCLLVSLVLELILAVTSHTSHYYKEQAAILELAKHKLFATPQTELSPAYHKAALSWFQPALLYGVSRITAAAGINNPFTPIHILRILSAVLGWLSALCLIVCSLEWFRSQPVLKWAIFACCFGWFVPSLHTQFTAVSWGASFFFIGFSFLIREVQFRLSGQKHPSLSPGLHVLSGLSMGFAFECHYGMALMIFFGVLWHLIFGKPRALTVAMWVSGFLGSVLVGTLCDLWGYGRWVFAPWNYLQAYGMAPGPLQGNLYPWWYYIRWAFAYGGPVINIFIVAGVFGAWLLKPKFSLTWCTLPFFVALSAVPFKSLYFILPLAPAVPILTFMTVGVISQTQLTALWYRCPFFLRAGFVWLCFAMNLLLLLGLSVTTMRGPEDFFKHLYQKERPLVLYAKDPHPYQNEGREAYYYRPEGLSIRKLTSYDAFLKVISRSNDPVYLFVRGLELPQDAAKLGSACVIDYRTLPRWVTHPDLLGWVRLFGQDEWTLYRCTGNSRMIKN